jgi:hypothetical protein
MKTTCHFKDEAMIDDSSHYTGRDDAFLETLRWPDGRQIMRFLSQQEQDVMFGHLAKNGPMEVSPDGEIRKLEE